MKTYESVGLMVPEVLLPREGVALDKWAVVACDQYTSEPDYWAEVEAKVGDAPSTLRLVFPEVFLGKSDGDQRIENIRQTMQKYVDEGLLVPRSGFVYVERMAAGRLRKGLVVALDLDAYDYREGSASLVRATEGTIVDRLPPRIRVREGAPMELPHIMVLIDDPDGTVIEPLAAQKSKLESVYDFELMMKGGHIAGFCVADEAIESKIVNALGALADPAAFQNKYGVGAEAPVLLYAMGDGNHSLATAKAIWEKAKAAGATPDDPRRYALVELVNVHDQALAFEPIHRVLFDVKPNFDLVVQFRTFLDDGLTARDVPSLDAMTAAVAEDPQRVGLITHNGYQVLSITKPQGNLAVASVQPFLNSIEDSGAFGEVDYVHGTAATDRLGRKAQNLALFLPGMQASELFQTVILDGALPRKTFSMGEADEKRFYLEARAL